MVLFDSSEVCTFPLDVYFSFREHFSPGFPIGGGFPAEQNTHRVLCRNRILPELKKKTVS
jgi:hypothetical protein